MMQLIHLFQANGWQITFASPAKLGEHKVNLAQLSIKEQEIELNNSSFDAFLQTLQPGLVIFDRFMMEEQFGWRVEQFAPDALRALNTEDLHSLRACRQQLVKDYLNNKPQKINLEEIHLTDQAWLFNEMAKTDMAKREIASIFRCDLTLMISQFEMQLLDKYFQVPSQQLFYLPFMYKAIDTEQLPTFEQRKHFVTIGNFRHEPNWDAVLWLKESIWPLIKKQLPDAELHIYGAYPPPKATALHNPKQGFLVKGWAEDAFEVIQNARVLLAPLRFGAGIKGKIAEAMLNGTPSVTTLIGEESMLNDKITGWPGATANNPDEFANAAIELYQNYQAWLKSQAIGFNNVNQQYVLNEKEPISDFSLINTLNTLLESLDNHRNQNFISSMLNHHHHKSTKYMAQWIEAKNKPTEKL
ncbi:glycosyltransferase [Thiomicrorhabdus lithotrophica]|uniref:Glycosyltransferase family 4 protein n=1 Tax=Thiomicrorhabdus lithotrophica TaxID=2949997 RepID=A0ABY8CAV3_9GAMM|nr:glycosyltransferase family 4 protein [Thiomicrorhabdus lithotrophica]WEJ61696.1 glycosyltransferase family 4 protein [Thiomicrorhabdus lithotrophica]